MAIHRTDSCYSQSASSWKFENVHPGQLRVRAYVVYPTLTGSPVTLGTSLICVLQTQNVSLRPDRSELINVSMAFSSFFDPMVRREAVVHTAQRNLHILYREIPSSSTSNKFFLPYPSSLKQLLEVSSGFFSYPSLFLKLITWDTQKKHFRAMQFTKHNLLEPPAILPPEMRSEIPKRVNIVCL